MSTKYTTSHQFDRKPTGYENWSHEAIKARKRELEAWLLKKFPMPPTETDEDAHIERVLQQHKHLFKSAPTHIPAPLADDAQPVDGNELLQEVTQFIARYLQCSEHQRTLLAFWVLHTYCFCAARVTPYLAIRSADKQSGKTLCLQLLSLLCDRAALTSGGFTARDLALPMREKAIAALLFDECQLTIGTRIRPRSPALRAVLAGSFHLGLGHRNIAEERNAFLPKAFASEAALPEELADRCIPIILEPLQAAPSISFSPSISSTQSTSSTPSTEIPERFDLFLVREESARLRDRLERWTKNHFSLLTNRTLLPRSAFPPNLSPRQQDLCDPLLQIAALIGGPWVARALQACAVVFDLQSIFELRPNLQLLAGVRDCFAYHNWPDRLPTELLQDWTDSLPARQWDSEGPMNGYKLARMLGPFEIRPRNQRIGKADPRRGYELKDFKEPWKKHLNFDVPQPKVPPAPASHGASLGSEIANKDAACNTVSRAGKCSVPAPAAQAAQPQQNKSGAQPPGSPSRAGSCLPRDGVGVPSAVSGPQAKEPCSPIEGPAARSQQLEDRSIINKNAPCNTVSQAHATPASTPTIKSQINNQKSEMSVDTLHGIHRLKTLHSKLRLQGICPPFEALAASYLPHHLHAALDWVEAHPEWCSNLRYKPALEFVAAFQKTLAVLTMKGA